MDLKNRTIGAVLLLLSGASATGCEFIATVERNEIPFPSGGVSGTGGIDGTGATGGMGGAGGEAGMGGAGGMGMGGAGGMGMGGAGGMGMGGAGGMGMGGAGGGPECTTATDCPLPINECVMATCVAGACGTTPLPSGTLPPTQPVGDCTRAVCDGAGMITNEPDDTDVLDDGLDCTINECAMGQPISKRAPVGTACTDSGGEVCDKDAQCVVLSCGDGILAGDEECDDGNRVDGDGCDNNCLGTRCGNGALSAGETCDDENTISGDGCSATCQVEPDYQCASQPLPSVCVLAETNCSNAVDDDFDMLTDLEDPDCDLAKTIAPCGVGESLYIYNALGAPAVIPDLDTIHNIISVSTGGTAQRAVVRLSITHNFDADLDISLRSPQGASIELSTDNGGDGNNYTSTVFDDGCSPVISQVLAPFTGCYQPQQALTTLTGKNPDGVWSLDVGDDVLEDRGTLLEWSLALCVAP